MISSFMNVYRYMKSGPRGKAADFTTGTQRGLHHLSQAPHRDGNRCCGARLSFETS